MPAQLGQAGQVASLLLLLLQTLLATPRLWIAAAAVGGGVSDRDRVVYWNASNPLFQVSGENVVPVSVGDRINFVCPSNGLEYYQIYWTPNSDYAQLCSGGSLLFSCRKMESYLVYVQIFPADPTAPGFLNPVYFYTPSTGDLLGLEQTAGGACQARNMRITVRTDSATIRPPASSSGDVTTSARSDGRVNDPQTPTTASAPSRSSSPSASSASVASTAAPTTKATTSATGRDPSERVDFARINLITGSAAATPTVVMVAALTCLALAATWLTTACD